MGVESLIKKAKYYEQLTRQYTECKDFLSALKNDSKLTSVNREFVNEKGVIKCSDIVVATPSGVAHLSRVNLVRDLGFNPLTFERIRQCLIQETEDRIQAIEDELLSVFGQEELKHESIPYRNTTRL